MIVLYIGFTLSYLKVLKLNFILEKVKYEEVAYFGDIALSFIGLC